MTTSSVVSITFSRQLPWFYLPLLAASTMVSLFVVLIDTVESLQVGVVIGVVVSGVLIARDALAIWRGEGVVGRVVLNFGVFYWFWMGAATQAFQSPPFPNPGPFYPYFFQTVPSAVVASGLLSVNLFALMAMLGWRYAPIPMRWVGRLADRKDPPGGALVDAVCAGLALLGWLPTAVAYNGNVAQAMADMMLMRANPEMGATQSVGVLQQAYLLGLFGGALSLARLVLRSEGVVWLRYFALALIFPLAFLAQGSRFNLGFLLLPAAIVLLARPSTDQLSWKKKRRTAIALIVVIIAAIGYQGAVRNFGVGGGRGLEGRLAAGAGSNPETTSDILAEGHVGNDHFGAMLMAIDLVNVNDGFFMEFSESFFVTHYIPRAIWPEKPYSQSWGFYNEMVTQGAALNVTPSIIGQYYLNWGYLGVIYIGVFMGWLARLCEAWLSRLDFGVQLMSATVAGLLLGFIFLSFRVLHPLYFAYPLFGYLTYRLMSRSPIANPRRRF